MEKLKQACDRLDSSSRNELCSILSLPARSSKNRILQSLVSITGLNYVLHSLSSNELAVFSLLAQEENGLIFSEIEKNVGIKVVEIEAITESLQNKLLLYVFKNRKHLNNRFDKAYIFPPFFEILRKADTDPIGSWKAAAETETPVDPHKRIKDRQGVLDIIYSHGSIITLNTLLHHFSGNELKLNATLEELHNDRMIKLFFVLRSPFSTVLMLTGETAMHLAHSESATDTTGTIQNRYMLLLNILHTYDVIKSNGLFFTQQQRFRKTDLKKLHQQIIPLHNYDGSIIDEETSLQLALYFLHLLDCTNITKTNIFTSLSPVKRYLHTPDKLTEILLKSISKKISDDNFESPIQIPQKNHVEYVLRGLKNVHEKEIFVLRTQFIYHFAGKMKDTADLDNRITHLAHSFTDTINFLVIAGVVNRRDAYLSSSHTQVDTETTEPTIYINPDFSLIIPKNDTPGVIQYIVLAFSSIVKNDITINAQITKEAVLNAYKRGMKADIFTEALERHAKNELPQNMTFLIHEWIKQSLNININFGTIIEVNHQSFLDELEFKQPDSIIRRLSDRCAIIETDKVDDIVKLGEKHKALIRIDLVQ